MVIAKAVALYPLPAVGFGAHPGRQRWVVFGQVIRLGVDPPVLLLVVGQTEGTLLARGCLRAAMANCALRMGVVIVTTFDGPAAFMGVMFWTQALRASGVGAIWRRAKNNFHDLSLSRVFAETFVGIIGRTVTPAPRGTVPHIAIRDHSVTFRPLTFTRHCAMPRPPPHVCRHPRVPLPNRYIDMPPMHGLPLIYRNNRNNRLDRQHVKRNH